MPGRRAIVTGASKGIGRAIATLLGQRGYAVALVARSQDLLDGLAEELSRQSNAAPALALAADLRDVGNAPRLVEAAAAGLGGLDLLLNCAGRRAMMRRGTRLQTDEAGRQASEIVENLRPSQLDLRYRATILQRAPAALEPSLADPRGLCRHPHRKPALWPSAGSCARPRLANRVRVRRKSQAIQVPLLSLTIARFIPTRGLAD